jgi:hypothetical protein
VAAGVDDSAADADRDRKHFASQPVFDHRQIRILRPQISAQKSGEKHRGAKDSAFEHRHFAQNEQKACTLQNRDLAGKAGLPEVR